MTSVKRFLSTKSAQKLPESIKSHEYFSQYKSVPKIFPQIGLPNDRVRNAYNDPEFGQLDLVFSSSGGRGLYDLATMSMRGAMSCMHFENRHSTHLIGSIVDPFCAIIYLTDRKRTEYGRSIIKRSLVRLIAKYKDNSPCIYIERPYTKSKNTDPQIYDNRCDNYAQICEVFKRYLQSKTDIEISHAGSPYIGGYIPKFQPLQSVLKENEYSMSDSGYAYHYPSVATGFLSNLRGKMPQNGS
jgi:hypothetical protein